MTSRADLIAELEKATAGSRSLDNHIAYAIGWTYREDVKNDFKWRAPGSDGQAYLVPPEFSRSLDAAITLAPKGLRWLVRSHNGQGNPNNGEGKGAYGLGSVYGDGDDDEIFSAFAATPAIALCIAALKAAEE